MSEFRTDTDERGHQTAALGAEGGKHRGPASSARRSRRSRLRAMASTAVRSRTADRPRPGMRRPVRVCPRTGRRRYVTHPATVRAHGRRTRRSGVRT